MDIESYKPKAPSFSKRIFGNPLVQLTFFLAIIGGAGVMYFTGASKKQTPDRFGTSSLQMNSMPAGGQPGVQASADMPPTAEMPPAAALNEEASRDPASLPASGVAPASNLLASEAQRPGGDAAGTGKDATAAKTGSPKIIVYYAEVNAAALKRIFDESADTGQFVSFPDYNAGILPGVEKRISPSNLNIKILSREERNLDTKVPLHWFIGRSDIGLTTDIEPMDLDADSFRGNIQIHRNWLELNPQQAPEVVRRTFPAIFEIAQGTGFFISGVVPRRTPLDQDNDFTSMDVYKILRSPAFQKGDSEFVIFIEFVKGN
ncbi:hypothetical protein D3C87_1319160 [compost metagenome]